MAPARRVRVGSKAVGWLTVALPQLTLEQRLAALEKASAVRKARAELKERLKHNDVPLADVLAMGDDEAIGKMRIATVLAALPGMGQARVEKTMTRLGIAPNRRIRGLGAHQRQSLIAEFGDGEG